MSPRFFALGALLTGALMALMAAGQRWSRVSDEGGELLAAGSTSAVIGADLTQVLALLALIGTVLMLVLRVRGRRVLGLLLAVLGLGMALAGALLSEPSAAQLTGHGAMVTADVINPTPWRVSYAIGGALVLIGGLLTMITAPRWPTAAARFDRDEPPPAVGPNDDPGYLWKAMDAGQDPTDTPPPVDPNVRNPASGDTMRTANQSQQSSRRN